MSAGPGESVLGRTPPSWAVDHDVRGAASGPNHRSTVPQHPDRATLFEAIPAGPIALDGGLVLCRVEVTAGHPWDSRGLFGRHVDPDITYRISVGETSVTARGEEDVRSAVIAIPGVSLASGESFSIRAIDRDTGRDDEMGTAELVFPGSSPFPGTSDGPGALRYECRAAAREWAEQRAATHFGVSDVPLAALRDTHPNLRGGVVEFRGPDLAPVHEPLFAAAGLLGWGHPALRARLELIEGAAARFREELAGQVAAAQSELPAPGEPVARADGSRVRVREAGCEPQRAAALGTESECYLVLEVVLAGRSDLAVVPTVYLVSGTGDRTRLQMPTVVVAGTAQENAVHIPTGSLATLSFGLESHQLGREPAPPVVVVGRPADATALRVF